MDASQLDESLPTARWWHATDEPGRIVCELCPRRCSLRPGQRAFCFVRENVDGEMVLSTYGRSTGFCIDPIEKKPLDHFLPGTSVLSFGTAGCNLGCKFCQNWTISKARETRRLSDRARPEEIAATAAAHGARSVAFTYNDPVLWAEYAIDTAIACHERGVRTVAVTAGYITERARADFFEHLDAANVDLKAFTERFYHKLCLGHLAPVLDTLEWLAHEKRVWIEITTLLIPGENDDPSEIAALCEWVVERLGPEVPLHFTAFHPDFRMTDVPPTSTASVRRARRIALDSGARHVYTGNVMDPAGQSTSCAGCGALLIERDGYTIGRYRLRDGACPDCGRHLAGVFESRPGSWGSRRLPVRIHPTA